MSVQSSPDLLTNERKCGDVALPVDPFVSNRYHFGMLLGVADLDADQGYHRGKTWLHNAWLHGIGVVWGLDVTIDPAKNELTVHPGLAIDGHGRELRVEKAMCLDLVKWFEKRSLPDLVVRDVQGEQFFVVDLELCHDSCLYRPVPSISEPCEDASFDTAYSRSLERGLPRLVVPPKTGPAEMYPLLRQFFGQAPITEQVVTDARAAVAAALPEDHPSTVRDEFRRLAAIDVTRLAPEPGAPSWSPIAGDGCVPLAHLRVHLRPSATGLQVVPYNGTSGTFVDTTIRPAIVRTRTIQELLCPCDGGPPGGPVEPQDPEHPNKPPGDGFEDSDENDPPPVPPETPTRLQAVRGSARLDARDLFVTFTAPLNTQTVHKEAFVVSTLQASGWNENEIDRTRLLDDGVTVTITLKGAPKLRPVRVVAIGTGSSPLIAVDGAVLSGVVGDPYVPSGSDAALMITGPEEG